MEGGGVWHLCCFYFTKKSLHPDQQAMVPAVLINETQFHLCLYDSEKDVLLISESKSLVTKGGLSTSGMAGNKPQVKECVCKYTEISADYK